MFSRRAASEFPNDNPELHDGLVWQSDSVTGHALPTLRLRQLTGTLPKVIGPDWVERAKRVVTAPREPARPVVAAPLESSPAVVAVAEAMRPEPALVEVTTPEPARAPVEATLAPAPVEATLAAAPAPVEATPSESASFVTAELVTAELEAAEAELPAPEPTPFDALVAALTRVALDRGATRVAAELPALLSGARGSTAVADTARARSLLALSSAWRFALEGGDLSGCGDQPLDQWASELLATLLVAPGEREALRRALRRHGVAAFGMLVAA